MHLNASLNVLGLKTRRCQWIRYVETAIFPLAWMGTSIESKTIDRVLYDEGDLMRVAGDCTVQV